MLLKVGVAMVLLSLALAIGVSIVVIGLRSEASETTSPSSAKPQTAEKTPEKKEINPGEKLQIDHSSDDGSGKQSGPTPGSSSDSIPDWPGPSNEELASTDGPRYFDPNPGAIMTLTVPALGLYDAPVFSSDNLQALDDSLMHVPETSLPWDGGAQRNVYIAGHYLGWPGTASRLVFYNLDKLSNGDEVVLKDRQGRIYSYRVSESFVAGPEESWVMGQEVGRDMVTLQTCIPPNFDDRLIVQADRA